MANNFRVKTLIANNVNASALITNGGTSSNFVKGDGSLDSNTYATINYTTGISGYLQNQVTNLNNQTGNYYLRNNPSGYITGVDLSSYATVNYTTGISGSLQTQISNLSNNTGSYILNSQTGDFTLNGSFTGNSTRNSLPNQTLVNSGSILTRDLMAMFLEKDIYNFSPTSFSASTAISGASVSLNSNAIFLRGNTTTQASPNNLAMATVGTQNSDVGFISISNSSSYTISGGNRGGADPAYSILDFSKRVILQFELSTNFKHVASNHNFFARLGPGGSAVNTNTGQALLGTGLGVGSAYVAMLMETGSIRLVTNKNLQNPTESPNQLVSPILASLTPFTTATAKFSLSVYSGTADLYIGNQYIGSQTGCPTHVSAFSHGIAFGCNSLAATSTVGAGYVVSNIKIITLPN